MRGDLDSVGQFKRVFDSKVKIEAPKNMAEKKAERVRKRKTSLQFAHGPVWSVISDKGPNERSIQEQQKE